MVQKMQANMNIMNKEASKSFNKSTNKTKGALEMNNPKNPKNHGDIETSTAESFLNKRNDTCWRKFLDCLGLTEMPENERFIKE